MVKERHREKERKRDRKGETLNHLSIHQWVRSAIFASHQFTSPIGFPFLKLLPPPCAVLLVYNFSVYIYIYIYIILYNRLQWYPQQPQCLIFTDLSEAFCEAKRWNDPTAISKASQTFSGTFSGTLLNLTWLCTKASRPSPEPSEPSLEPRWTWPGACTSAHRSYSRLKTPLAYAVGEKYLYTVTVTCILHAYFNIS